jgi:acyl dehydratase
MRPAAYLDMITLPPLERRLDLPALVAYAAATWDWYPIHYDPDAVEAVGLPAPVVDGQMLGALLAEQALDWATAGARVTRMRFRLKSMVNAGETVRCESEVVSRDRRRITLHQRVLVNERVVIEQAELVLELPK